MALSRLHRLLKKSRPLLRSTQQCKLTLEALEDRTVLSFAPPVTFPVGEFPSAVTVADFNNDGKPDLAVVNQGPSSTSTSQSSVSVLLGNGDGSFQPAVTTDVLNSGLATAIVGSAAVGDFNGDGLPDVALNTAGPAGPAVEVLLGKGDGSFQPNPLILSVGETPLSVAAGDFDHNDALDLVTANTSSGTVSVLLGNGDGTFRPRTDLAVGGAPITVAVGDFNGDGRLDVVTAQQLTNTVSVLLGHGDGTFARPLVFAASGGNFGPTSLAVGDVNGDGVLDLAINSIVDNEGSVASQLGVLLGNGDGTFQAPILNTVIGGDIADGDVVLGDFNGDGLMDAAVGGRGNALLVFQGNGDGTFQSNLRLDLLTGGNDPLGVAAADLNGDGLVDLVAANASSSTVGVLINNSTNTTLSADVNPVDPGQTVILTARVTGAGIPTGDVTFRDGDSIVLGTATLDDTGTARLAVAFPTAGDHALTAAYNGSGSTFGVSTSPVLTETVNGAATSITLGSSDNPAVFGQTVVLTATVTSPTGVPTGTVTFSSFDFLDDSTTVLGTAQVNADGQATLAVSLGNGAHSLTASFGATAAFVGSTSAAVTEIVNAAATTVTLTSSVNPAVIGQAVTFTATVAVVAPGAGTPTGTVSFFDGGGVFLGDVAVGADGTATLTTSFEAESDHPITATYIGDQNFFGSSQTISQLVIVDPSAAKTTTTLQTSTATAVFGQPVTLTATVTSPVGVPTGTVTFKDGDTVLGIAQLDTAGHATLAVSLDTGTHTLTASLASNESFAGSTSAAVSVTVNPAATTINLVASANPAVVGQAVTFTATVRGPAGTATPPGIVTFFVGNKMVAQGFLDANGQVTFTFVFSHKGQFSLRAVYSGDVNFDGSSSQSLTEQVNR